MQCSIQIIYDVFDQRRI